LAPLPAALAGALAAAGVMALVLLAFGTREVAVPLVLLGGALGVVAYVAVLLLTRQLRREELAGLLSRLSGLVGALRARSG
jgi:hypothetical protein